MGSIQLSADFFNRIGPERRLLRDSIVSGIGVKAEVSGYARNDVRELTGHRPAHFAAVRTAKQALETLH
jgi:hypothetical protein